MDQSANCHLTETVLQAIAPYADRNMVIALSGGIDSMVMLNIVSQVRKVVAVHTVGTCTERDFSNAQKLKSWADKVNLELHIHISPEGIKSISRLRKFKYTCMQKHLGKGDILISGHHLNDQIETLIIKSMKGHMLDGWTMRPIRPLGKGHLLRPMLKISKDCIRKYGVDNDVFFIEDELNLNLSYLRNEIRHKVIGTLLMNHPEALSGWKRGIQALEDNAVIHQSIYEERRRTCFCEGRLILSKLSSLTDIEQTYLLRFWMRSKSIYHSSNLISHFKENLTSSQKRWSYRISENIHLVKEDWIAYLSKNGKLLC